MPLKLTVCGVPGASLEIVKVPSRTPRAIGVNVTPIVQLAPGATEATVQFWLATPKSPVAATLATVRGASPLFVTLTVCAVLVVPTRCELNVRLVLDRVGTGATPVPLRSTTWVPGASEVIVRLPVRSPLAVGANLTSIVQLKLAPRVAAQLLVGMKSPLFVPVMVTPEIFSVAVPLLVRVTACGALVVPTS